jgi:YcaO-like protein with predicted kinase domain
MHAPRLKSHLRTRKHGLNRVVFASNRASFAFRGSVFVRLAALLDGITPVDEIVRRLAPRERTGDVYAALALLEAEGFLEDGPDPNVPGPLPAAARHDADEHVCGAAVVWMEPIEFWDGPPYICVAEYRCRPAQAERAAAGGWRSSFGKGASATEARASAFGEAVERCSGVFRDGCPTVVASEAAMRGSAVPPAELLLVGGAPLASAGRSIHWTPVRSLVSGCTRHVPTACCYYDAPADEGGVRWQADSNGTAAAPTEQEAILRALLELVERDAVAIWWYNRIPRPCVDLASFPPAAVGPPLAALASLGRTVRVFDLTHDLGVPVYAAVAADRVDGGHPVLGFGAHPDSVEAVRHAMHEAAQGLALRMCGAATLPPLTASAHPSLGREVPATRGRDEAGGWQTRTVPETLEHVVDAAARRGLDVLVLDQTAPDTSLAVARVIVPGLRHIWPRFAPGRLYSVPVAMNWLPTPLPESRLNPIPLFL